MALLFPPAERRRVARIGDLVHCNPFTADRIDHERAVLGDEFDERAADWNLHPDWDEVRPNVERLEACAENLLGRARDRLARGHRPTPEESRLYEELVIFALYHRSHRGLDDAAQASAAGRTPDVASTWEAYHNDARHFLSAGRKAPPRAEIAHLFACSFQARRAFRNVFDWIVGVSRPAVQLRAAVWQSVFTHDMRRYRRVLFDCMGDYMTLITGPSGTGKDLAARAVGMSRYIAFDPKTTSFAADARACYFPLSLSAMSPTLIESELFGHHKGAFTGAVANHKGWLEQCPPLGSVFLDEIGDVDASIQVKLLRVLEDGTFSRVGETAPLKFRGKIIAATNRDLADEMRKGRFREDFFYRLCSDTIRAPSLHERLADSPQERRHLVAFLCQRLVHEDCGDLADQVEEWIDGHLGPDYPWPGNVRELDQCVRNIVVRREYHPPTEGGSPPDDPYLSLADAMRSAELTAEDVLARYCALVYRATGSFDGAARKLGLDRRTVKAKVQAAGQRS